MSDVVLDWHIDFYDDEEREFIHRVVQPAGNAVIPRKGEKVSINLHLYEVTDVKYFFESNHVVINVQNVEFPKPYPERR